MDRDKWIGLAEVAPASDEAALQEPAFVNVIALAWEAEQFVETIRTECASLGLTLVSMEDVELWSARLLSWQPEPEIVSLAEGVTEDMPIAFGTFVCYPDDE